MPHGCNNNNSSYDVNHNFIFRTAQIATSENLLRSLLVTVTDLQSKLIQPFFDIYSNDKSRPLQHIRNDLLTYPEPRTLHSFCRLLDTCVWNSIDPVVQGENKERKRRECHSAQSRKVVRSWEKLQVVVGACGAVSQNSCPRLRETKNIFFFHCLNHNHKSFTNDALT